MMCRAPKTASASAVLQWPPSAVLQGAPVTRTGEGPRVAQVTNSVPCGGMFLDDIIGCAHHAMQHSTRSAEYKYNYNYR